MARSAHNDVLDALLNEIATSTKICVCDTEPTTHAQAATTYMLAATAIVGGNFSGPAEGSLGTAGGRKLTFDQLADISISNTGTATHIALLDGNNVQFVTECTEQVLTSGGTVTVPAFIIEVEDPVAPA
jgi:hypothetical protein